MDDHQSPKGYGHLLPDPEDLAGILTELERKTAIGLTVSLPTTLLESSVSEYTSAQVPSRNQISSMAMKAPFFSSLVASTNSIYSFEQRKTRSHDVISSQAPVSPFQTFTDMLSSGDELLWSEFQSNNCQDLYSNQSISSLDLQKFEPYEDTRFELTGEEAAEVATVPRLQSSHTGSFKEPIPYNWEATHAASTSKTFHGMPPSSSEPLGSASTPDSFMYPSSSEDSDDASNKDDGAASDKESKRMILAKPSDETTDTVESKKPTRKVQKKAIKKQRGPRYALRTRSHVEVMDDGYRWRKYGQKAVKNSPFPRSYYRCTNVDCPVKKRVERSAEDPGLVITTYEGVHTHHSPATLSASPGFPLTSFQENAYFHLPLPSTASALPHHQFGLPDPIRGQLQPPGTDEGLLEHLLFSNAPKTS